MPVSFHSSVGSWVDELLLYCSRSVAVTTVGKQTSSNWEERTMSITKPKGLSAVFTCGIRTTSNYIHWYRFQKGRAPQRLLYYDTIKSAAVVDSGLNPEKYHVYEGTGKRHQFVLRNIEESDSALYYCASWADTMTQPYLYLYQKNYLAAVPSAQDRPAPTSLLTSDFLYSEKEMPYLYLVPILVPSF